METASRRRGPKGESRLARLCGGRKFRLPLSLAETTGSPASRSSFNCSARTGSPTSSRRRSRVPARCSFPHPRHFRFRPARHRRSVSVSGSFPWGGAAFPGAGGGGASGARRRSAGEWPRGGRVLAVGGGCNPLLAPPPPAVESLPGSGWGAKQLLPGCLATRQQPHFNTPPNNLSLSLEALLTTPPPKHTHRGDSLT